MKVSEIKKIALEVVNQRILHDLNKKIAFLEASVEEAKRERLAHIQMSLDSITEQQRVIKSGRY